jgi:hypothetical protein
MKYTASSVRKTIEKAMSKKELYSEDLDILKCPIVGSFFGDGRKCHGNPASCPEAREQTCKHRVDIFKNKSINMTPFAILNFYFTISDTNHDGFISAGDIVLRRLILKGYISVEDLTVVATPTA